MPICPTCRASYGGELTTCPSDGDDLVPNDVFAAMDLELEAGDGVGDYRIEAKLGEGGFGVVYRAVHAVIGKHVALKVLSKQYSSNPEIVSRFVAEARAVNQVQHDDIVDIFAFGVLPDGRQYFAMELLEGVPLDVFMRQGERLTPGESIALLRVVAGALAAAHAAGIIHRDLKPENVFLVAQEDGSLRPKLLDFGIAKATDALGSGHRTRTGIAIGTPTHMSPEQCRGQKIDARTDVYSFGVMCFEMLTGRRPFDANSSLELMMHHMKTAPPKPSSLARSLPRGLDAPLMAMLAKTPDGRPPTIRAAFEALAAAAVQAGYNIDAPVAYERLTGAREAADPLAATVEAVAAPGARRVRIPSRMRLAVVAAVVGVLLVAGLGAAARRARVAAPASASEPALAPAGQGVQPAGLVARVPSPLPGTKDAPISAPDPPALALTAGTNAPRAAAEVRGKPVARHASPRAAAVPKDFENPF